MVSDSRIESFEFFKLLVTPATEKKKGVTAKKSKKARRKGNSG